VLISGMLWLAASGASAQQATQPNKEAKLLAELYGQRIAKAKTTTEPDDDIALAGELLSAAADSANPALLRYLLAREGLKLTSPLGTAEAARLARTALALADQLQPLGPMEKTRLALVIARSRYGILRKEPLTPEVAARVAGEMIGAEIAHARALMKAGQIEAAKSALQAAEGRAKAHRLPAAYEETQAAMKELKAAAARAARIRSAQAQLAQARAQADTKGIKEAKAALGHVYLLSDGDIAKANAYLPGTDSEYASAVAAAAAFVKDSKTIPAGAKCNAAAEGLSKAATAALNEEARTRIGMVAARMCREFLKANDQGLEATRARLLLIQAERLAGDSPADRLIKRLKANYKGLEAKLEVLNNGPVRATCDFTSVKQMGDWDIDEGQWQILPKKGILVGANSQRGRARAVNRLRFHGDKPLTLTFRVSGKQDLNGLLFFRRGTSPKQFVHEVRFGFGINGNRESRLEDGGQRVWSSNRAKVAQGATYRVVIAWNGAGGVCWTINGKMLCKHEIRYRREDLATASLYVGLETSGRAPAGFDDVVIEGGAIADPRAQDEGINPKTKK